MKANELRKGCLLYFLIKHKNGGPIKGRIATALTTAQINKLDELENPEDLWEPIPLSPEILQACGFVKETGDYFKDSIVYNNKIRLYQHDNNDYSLYGFNECKVWVFYLHELQNLFASITGSELSINLEKVKA